MLRVLASLLGPIFAKEAVEIARRKRYYVNRVLYGLVLLVSLFVVLQAPDVALSELVVSTVAFPFILFTALAKMRDRR